MCPLRELGDDEQVSAMARALIWDGMQGAKRSNSRSYCEHLQRSRPPEAADAHGAVICADGMDVSTYTAVGLLPDTR